MRSCSLTAKTFPNGKAAIPRASKTDASISSKRANPNETSVRRLPASRRMGHAEEAENNLMWGNSGVFMLGKYELQIIESHDSKIYADGIAAAIYGQTPPLVNAARKPGEWQSYDIVFTAPQFNGDKLLKPAYFTVLWNGGLVKNHTASLGPMRHRKSPLMTREKRLGRSCCNSTARRCDSVLITICIMSSTAIGSMPAKGSSIKINFRSSPARERSPFCGVHRRKARNPACRDTCKSEFFH